MHSRFRVFLALGAFVCVRHCLQTTSRNRALADAARPLLCRLFARRNETRTCCPPGEVAKSYVIDRRITGETRDDFLCFGKPRHLDSSFTEEKGLLEKPLKEYSVRLHLLSV